MTATVSTSRLADLLRDARARTLELVSDLDDGQLMGPKLETVNPLLWEIGHVAYFYEYFILRQLYGRAPILANADELYDSIAIPHAVRWDLPLLSRTETHRYMNDVLDALIERLPGDEGEADAQDSFIYQFGAFHEDMHGEAFAWTRQTLAYPTPALAGARHGAAAPAEPLGGFAEIPGGTWRLGSPRGAAFVFDNEKWAHAVTLAPFRIARTAVSNAAFAAFVDDGGYGDARWWSEAGWRWRCRAGAKHPLYWRADGPGRWSERRFDRWVPLDPACAAVHVCAHEAEAYCAWAGGRLPREAEWEAACLALPDGGGFADDGRRYPWGDAAPAPAHAALDGRALGSVDVAAFSEGDSPFGCRQMIGNVWEWTATTFAPFPGFAPDAYRDYSQPLFGSTRVLRGGAWTTRSHYVDGKHRNYFEPDRRDVFAGFRLCRDGD
ncbi:MAG: selenoneine synthase SenA [Rhodospirillales bacterium]